MADFKEIKEINAVDSPTNDINWNVTQQTTESDVKLEQDEGYGKVALIRRFVFKTNPQTFKENPPTKQQLFNAHLKQIEIILWQDGLKIMTEVEPQLNFDKKKKHYTITIGAIPARGQLLPSHIQPMTLSQIAHGKQSKA